MTSSPNPSAESPTLYDALGQEPAVKEVVSRFYRRVLADPQLAGLFTGIDTERLERHQVAFFTKVLGGPDTYSGRAIQSAHSGLDITDAQFDAVAGHLQAVLEELGVDQDAIGTVIGMVATLRDDIVARPS